MHREFGPLEWSAGSHELISSLPTVTVAQAARHEAGLPFCSSASLVSGLGSSRASAEVTRKWLLSIPCALFRD